MASSHSSSRSRTRGRKPLPGSLPRLHCQVPSAKCQMLRQCACLLAYQQARQDTNNVCLLASSLKQLPAGLMHGQLACKPVSLACLLA